MTALSPSAVLSALATAIGQDPGRWPRRGEPVPADVAGFRDNQWAYVLPGTWQAIGPDSGALAVMHDRGDLHVPPSWRRKNQWNAPAPAWSGVPTAYKVALTAITSPAPDPATNVPSVATPAAASVAAAWDPPGQPRDDAATDESCPSCGEPGLLASPRSTARACKQCKALVIPASVAAPYERGDVEASPRTRQVRTQRETDLEALEVANRKGVMLGQLRELAADDKLDDGSAGRVEWFTDEVKAAATQARLDDLADLFASVRLKRRYFWQGRPATITVDGYEDDDDEWDDEDGQDDAPGTQLATPASIAAQQHQAQPQRATWAEAITALGWRTHYATQWEGCVIIDHVVGWCCSPNTVHGIGTSPGAWVCANHYAALSSMLAKINRERGFQ